MKCKKKIAKYLIYIFLILLLNYLLLNYIGKSYLAKLNKLINQNNNVIIKQKINDFIKNNSFSYDDDLYSTIYNDNHEIVDLNMNLNKINIYLSDYITVFSKNLNDINLEYLKRYYESIKLNKSIYFLISMGILSNNPLLYNYGPKIIFNYDSLYIPSLKIEITAKNYGLNNALIETYLIIHIDQNIFKPFIKTISMYDYKFLVSSRIINGRVSNYLGINKESEYIMNN